MNNLYHLSDSEKYLDTLKKYRIITILVSVFTWLFIVLLTVFTNSKAVMVADIALSSLYFMYLDIYIFFIRKYYLSMYHFLAVIDNYEHKIIKGRITGIKETRRIIKNKATNEVEVNDENAYFLECGIIDIKEYLNKSVTLEIADNFIIGIGEDDEK